MAGVDSTGYIPKTLTDIISSLQTGYRGVYGATVNIASRSRIGQRIALFAAELSEVWELGEAIFNALDPDQASGPGLDALMKLNGLTRKPATFSQVTLTFVGNSGASIPSNKEFSVGVGGQQFHNVVPATLLSLFAWAANTAMSVGQRRTNAGNVYQVIAVTGDAKTAASGGPTTTDASIADHNVTWTFLGTGNGAVDTVGASADDSGPVQGYARTINTIVTPVGGLNSVINLLDAQTGQDAESDAQARARRALSFGKAAASPLEAVRTAVLAVNGVTSCTIFENFTDTTDANGVPPHSFETLVEGGVDADILAAIFSTRPGGIQAYGTTSGTVLDSMGTGYTMAFSRPVAVNIYVDVTLKYDARFYPTNGDVQVEDNVATQGNMLPVGKDVVASAIGAALFPPATNSVAGMLDVSAVKIGTAPSPSGSTTITITSRQRASFDSSRVTVNSSPGTF